MSEPIRGNGRHRTGAIAGKLSAGMHRVRPRVKQPSEQEHERRGSSNRPGKSRWHTGRDRLIVLAIAVVCVATSVLVWLTGDQRATISETSQAGAELPAAPDAVPNTLTELWQAPSPATPVPVAEGTSVVTAVEGEVLGRDPITGQPQWRYARDLPLCTVASAWSRVMVLHQQTGAGGRTGCSEVTQLDASTGQRTAQRNGDAQTGTQLLSDGTHVTATGADLLHVWRDDLVKTMEYGKVPALVNPDKQPRTGCSYGSVAVASGKIGVVERCQGDPADRFSVIESTAEEGKDADEPSEVSSTVLPGRSATLVAMTADRAAIALPEQNLLALYETRTGKPVVSYPLPLHNGELTQDPAGKAATTAATDSSFYWFTGSKTIALAKSDLTPQWTLEGTLGPATGFANELVVPINGGLAIVDPTNGSTLRTIGVDRHGYPGVVRLASTGPVLLEQRGENLAALR